MVKSVPLQLKHCELLLHLCKNLDIVISWEKLDLEPTNKAQYFRMLIDAIRVHLTDTRLTRFWGVTDKFLLQSPPAEMWQQILGFKASQEQFLHPLQWQLMSCWFFTVDNPVTPVTSLEECRVYVRLWLQEERRMSRAPLQAPPPSLLLLILTVLTDWG